eukprot:1856931-Pyramimonas_sp.AAC.1
MPVGCRGLREHIFEDICSVAKGARGVGPSEMVRAIENCLAGTWMSICDCIIHDARGDGQMPEEVEEDA